MTDFARADSGAVIAMATCTDYRHPPENVLDGKETSFWLTTGGFPQELVVQLKSTVKIAKIQLATTNARKVMVERCELDQPTKFDKVSEMEFGFKEGRLQVENLNQTMNLKAKFVKITIAEGWEDFCSVHRVSIIGDSE